MRYFEYVYMAVAVGLVVFLATNYKYFTTLNVIAVMVGIGIASFMFTFRRSQRIMLEAEEARRLEDGDDSEEEEAEDD